MPAWRCGKYTGTSSKLRQKVAWPQKKWDFPWTWTWQFPAIFTNLLTKKDIPLPWLFSNEIILNPSPRSHGSIVDSPPLNGELDHVTHTWSVLPAIAEVQKDILRSDGNIWKHPNRAVVHSVNNPFVSICSAICIEFMWICESYNHMSSQSEPDGCELPGFPPKKTQGIQHGMVPTLIGPAVLLGASQIDQCTIYRNRWFRSESA